MDKKDTKQKQQEFPIFPYQVFDEASQKFITEVAASVNCPVDFPGVGVLASNAIAVGNSSSIKVKKAWKEKTIFYIVGVGESGVKKTPSFSLALAPIEKLQADNWEEYKKEEQKTNEGEGNSEPILTQLLTTDTTIEGLIVLLQNNPHGILISKDELIGWLKSMNQYKGGGSGDDMEYYLSLWSGKMIIVNRKSVNKGKPIQINNPFVSVFGGIQTEILSELGNLKDNGFVYRILYSVPNKIDFKHTEEEIDDKTQEDYYKVISNIYQKVTRMEKEDKTLELGFSPEAKKLWVEWHKKHIDQMNDPEMPYYLIAAWSKLEAYMARFSLLLEHNRLAMSNELPTNISKETANGAIKLTEYFKAHARKAFELMFSSDLDKRIVKAYQWVKKHDGRVTARQFLSNRVTGTKNNEEVMGLFEEMKRRGLGNIEKTTPPHGGHATFTFIIKGYYSHKKVLVMKRKKKKHYYVWKGHKTGYFDDWYGDDGCEKSIKEFPDNQFLSFDTKGQAETASQLSYDEAMRRKHKGGTMRRRNTETGVGTGVGRLLCTPCGSEVLSLKAFLPKEGRLQGAVCILQKESTPSCAKRGFDGQRSVREVFLFCLTTLWGTQHTATGVFLPYNPYGTRILGLEGHTASALRLLQHCSWLKNGCRYGCRAVAVCPFHKKTPVLQGLERQRGAIAVCCVGQRKSKQGLTNKK